MVQPADSTSGGTPESKTTHPAPTTFSRTPNKKQAQGAEEGHRDKSKSKSSSGQPSPGSSGGRRGRSRTRNPSTPHNHVDQVAERQGYHSLMSSFGKVFHVEKRWKLIREMGSGAYGFVISAVDEVSGEPVAIKMITRVTQKVQLAKRALRELTLLRHFSHENITGLIDVDISPNHDEIYIFMEPMEADLHQIIKSGQSLTVEHVQYFVYQILRGLKYIHSASVVHRDLKPGNLLVNADCELKICDFGLSRGFNAAPDENATMMTEYVATRWYRAPEIMLAYRAYNTAVDIWATGCIVAELMLGRPLFKGKDYVDQLNKILEVLGSPDEEVMQKIGSEKAQAYVRSLPIKKAQPMKRIVPTADAEAQNFLQKLISFDPSQRPSAADALAHPWLATYHDVDDEPVCGKTFDRWREIEELETLDDFRDALVKEVCECRKEVRNMAAAEPESEAQPTEEQADTDKAAEQDESDAEEPAPLGGHISRSRSPEDRFARRPAVSRKASIEPGTLPPTIHEGGVAFPGGGHDPVVAYSRRSIFGPPSRTNSTYSLHRANPTSEANTVAFPSSGAGEYVVPARARTASMYTIAGEGGGELPGGSEVRRLLRTLSTVSIYESGEGRAGGLADVAPIGKYIGQRERTGEDPPESEMPREIAGESSSSASPAHEEGAPEDKRRFRVG